MRLEEADLLRFEEATQVIPVVVKVLVDEVRLLRRKVLDAEHALCAAKARAESARDWLDCVDSRWVDQAVDELIAIENL